MWLPARTKRKSSNSRKPRSSSAQLLIMGIDASSRYQFRFRNLRLSSATASEKPKSAKNSTATTTSKRSITDTVEALGRPKYSNATDATLATAKKDKTNSLHSCNVNILLEIRFILPIIIAPRAATYAPLAAFPNGNDSRSIILRIYGSS